MGGKSSSQTIGYWYKLLLFFGWGRGPLDALLEIRGGEKTAWAGVQSESGTISIQAKELWGGEKQEGGIEGDFDVMMGEPDQAPNSYLEANLGVDSAYRGRSCGAFKGGKYGAFNPYPKPMSFKLRRILKGWDDDDPWYPAKAPIPYTSSVAPVELDEEEYVSMGSVTLDPKVHGNFENPDTGIAMSGFDPEDVMVVTVTGGGWRYTGVPPYVTDFSVSGEDDIEHWQADNPGFATAADALAWEQDDGTGQPRTYTFTGSSTYRFWISDTLYTDNQGTITLTVRKFRPPAGYGGEGQPYAMNPAHMLYQSTFGADFLGEPLDRFPEANWIEAADALFDEGFGLCTDYDPTTETIEQFQARICNVIDARLSQSRVDGKYYLTLVRGGYDIESLPILSDDDIIEYEEEPSDPMESVNQVTVEWFDPERKEKRSTAPQQALGAIMATGGIIAETGSYPEIPYEDLANRACARDLSAKSLPRKRFNLTTNRRPWSWLSGQLFRLQAPRRGIEDMVLILGDLEAGTPLSGTMRLVAIQDVSGMPSTTYVEPEPPVEAPSERPTIVQAQEAMEVPYVELAGTLPAAELAALEPDAGFLMTVAKRAKVGLNYALYSGDSLATLVDRGTGDWCPTALVVEAALADPTQVAFTMTAGTDLDQVTVGTAALFGTEICRVDAIDADALTVTLGRGCADTIPTAKAASTRIWFYDVAAKSDGQEYVDGETAYAKLLTRTASAMLAESLATPLSVVMDSRAARPYPPGKFQVDGAYAPAYLFGTVDLTWAQRNRVVQDDQLVDSTAATIAAEASTTYTARWYLDNVLVATQAGLTGTSTTYAPAANGTLRIELEAVRDGLVSWQTHSREFPYTIVEPGAWQLEASTDRWQLEDGSGNWITE